MSKTIKTYEAIFEPSKTKGVYGISLVEDPAMKGMFVALNDAPIQFKTLNEDQQVLIGLVLEPNKPVYRNQDGEEFNIVFSEATIKDLAYNFYKGGFQSNSTLEHMSKIDGVTFVESWIIEDTEKDKSAAIGLSYPKGSWMATMKVDSADVWNDYVKTGKVKGFSIDALVSLKEVNFKNHIQMSKEGEGNILENAVKKGIAQFFASFSNKDKKDENKDAKIDLGAVKAGDVEINYEGDTMEVGGRVWVNAEDGTEVALPVGEYTLEDGKVLVVSEEGKIGEVKDAAPADPAPAATDTQMADDQAKQAEAIANAVKSVLIKYSEETEKRLDAMEAKFDAKLVELSNQPAAKPKAATPVQVKARSAKGRIFNALQNPE